MENKQTFDTTITKEKVLGHLKTITEHKMTVMDLCFKVGLVEQGLRHDLTKYLPVEFMTGARYYSGNHSPNADEKKDKGYSAAWMHHKGCNKHHFEYWLDVQYGTKIEDFKVSGAKMPLKYVLEMVCDRIAACKTYNKEKYTSADPLAYYNRTSFIVGQSLHDDTRALLEDILKMMALEGEKKAIAYMRWLLKHPDVYENGTYKRRLP